MTAKARFLDLWQDLRLPGPELARTLGIGYGTLKAYAAPGNPRIPPPAVLAAMEGLAFDRAVQHVRTGGHEVIRRRAA